MDFDLDDPLGDLLSDGSNDSFFGSTKSKKKSNETKNVSASNPKSGPSASKYKMEDLFGISSDKPEEKAPNTSQYSGNMNVTSGAGVDAQKYSTLQRTSSKLAEIETPKRVATPKKAETTAAIAAKQPAIKKEISFGDSDDILSELGFDPKKPKSAGKKSNFLDDLLGIAETKSAPVAPPPVRDIPRTPPRAAQRSTIAEPDIGSISSADVGGRTSSRYSPSSGRPRTNSGTAGTVLGTAFDSRPGSNALNDPLGLFAVPPQQDEPIKKLDGAEPRESKTSRLVKKPSMVDWLGLEPNKETTDVASQQKTTISNQSSLAQSAPPPLQIPSQTNTVNSESIPKINNFPKPDLSQTIQLMTTANADGETALESLQQQELHLQIASQMRNQEVALMDMQMKQQNLLKQQETNFNDLLRRQINRQSALEDSIKRQQEQINTHIQLLMTQPLNGRGLSHIENQEEIDEINVGKQFKLNPRNINIELEAELKKLELEKLRLEDLVQSIRNNHERELEFTESSHKKQIQMLEDNLANMESRLRDENKFLEEYYVKKLNTLETELNDINQKYIDENHQLSENHYTVLDKLRKSHEHDIELTRTEHQTMIQNMRESKLMEFSIVQENGSYLATLKNASNYLENASGDLQALRIEMEDKIDRMHKEREIQLDVREKRLEDQQRITERTKESAEAERLRLLELVKTLELKLNSVEQSSSEEQWTQRQQRNSLEAEKIAFEREKEFIREKQLADESRIQDLRNQQNVEHRRLMGQLEDERKSLLAEKGRIETIARLQTTPQQPTIAQCEIDAAVKVAQDAAEQADTERKRLLDIQRSFETKKRELINQKQIIRNKESELEASINAANAQKHENDYAMKTTKILEQKMIFKLQHLQRNFNELGEREAKLSQEKLELSKERIELQTIRKRLFQGRCSLCRIGERSQEISELLTNGDAHDLEKLAIQPSGISLDRLLCLNDVDARIMTMMGESHVRDSATTTATIDGVIDAQVSASLNRINRMGRQFEINLAAVPDITDISDNLLNPDLQMVKLDALNTKTYT